MSVTEIMEYNTTCSTKQRLMLMLAMHCAPLLRGSKVSNIVTIRKSDFYGIRELLKDTGISYRFLKARGELVILFLYRQSTLAAYLTQPQICEFISDYGYQDVCHDLKACLNLLAKRIYFFNNGEISFPHEIGVFLGYPLEDVRGFIENQGQNYEYSGYWKVYDNVAHRKQLFARFEADRDYVVRSIVRGKTLREIAG
ncbi:MAG: DUF3793 family protein [Lachnospiraceae bacterium]|nr:DUF3793 family protein [Lachnospiraceae bacterium]